MRRFRWRSRFLRRLEVRPRRSGSTLTIALSASWNVSGWSETGLAFGMTSSSPPVQTEIRTELVYVFAEAAASVATSAFCQDRLEDIWVVAVELLKWSA
jgi:hypothetical protein